MTVPVLLTQRIRRRRAAYCAAVAVCVIIEMILRWPAPSMFHLSYFLIPIAALLALLVLVVAPDAGAWLIAILVCMGLVSPFPMSYSYLLIVPVMLMIIWRQNRIAAGITAALAILAILVDRKLLFGLGVSDAVIISFAYCMIAVTLGVTSLWTVDRQRLRERSRQQHDRQCAAAALHDRTTNDLADAIMLIDHDLERTDLPAEQIADLHRLRRFIQHAMTGTYQVIDTLDDKRN
ncbi:Signal transduction histidine kinase-like protein [Bifidobacterium goeldii]|uniref:Signal transduction histidine kinase-like protein n=2 Tax=Bifidobacterium goeldii TaxID=2306975 RepID=A0A430FK12_9BIFI|nr:Signal transduction histidine kinase-like protein [Bifidobacterium goeldii]